MGGHQIIIRGLSESEFEAALQKKVGDGFTGEQDWGAGSVNFCCNGIGFQRTRRTEPETGQAMLRLWSSNIADNLPDIRNGKTIRDLTKDTRPCVLVGRGPSLLINHHPELLAKHQGKVCIVSTDGALPQLIKAGVNPNYSVSIDGHPSLVAKFYSAAPANEEMKIIVGASVAKATVDAARSLGELYWFLPLWDDYRLPESIVRVLTFMSSSSKNPNGCPALRAGAQAGVCALTVAFHLLGAKPIALIGMDQGYPEGFPYEETAYYKSAKEAGVNMETFQQIMTRYTHPVLGRSYADPVFRQYRKGMIDCISELPKEFLPISNCTEGGTLFGPNIECVRFEDWLERL